MMLIAYHDQSLKEQLAWHKAVSPHLTEKQLDDFSAGFSDGWRKAISAIKLHKITL
jgi:hypothetical protein